MPIASRILYSLRCPAQRPVDTPPRSCTRTGTSTQLWAFRVKFCGFFLGLCLGCVAESPEHVHNRFEKNEDENGRKCLAGYPFRKSGNSNYQSNQAKWVANPSTIKSRKRHHTRIKLFSSSFPFRYLAAMDSPWNLHRSPQTLMSRNSSLV